MGGDVDVSRVGTGASHAGHRGSDGHDHDPVIGELLDRINRTDTTVVMATHDSTIVDQMRKRVIELDDGHIVRDEARGIYGYQS